MFTLCGGDRERAECTLGVGAGVGVCTNVAIFLATLEKSPKPSRGDDSVVIPGLELHAALMLERASTWRGEDCVVGPSIVALSSDVVFSLGRLILRNVIRHNQVFPVSSTLRVEGHTRFHKL